MIVLWVLGILLAGFLLVWAFNLSFAAHLQEDNRAMRNMHIWSYAVIVSAIVLIVWLSHYASR